MAMPITTPIAMARSATLRDGSCSSMLDDEEEGCRGAGGGGEGEGGGGGGEGVRRSASEADRGGSGGGGGGGGGGRDDGMSGGDDGDDGDGGHGVDVSGAVTWPPSSLSMSLPSVLLPPRIPARAGTAVLLLGGLDGPGPGALSDKPQRRRRMPVVGMSTVRLWPAVGSAKLRRRGSKTSVQRGCASHCAASRSFSRSRSRTGRLRKLRAAR